MPTNQSYTLESRIVKSDHGSSTRRLGAVVDERAVTLRYEEQALDVVGCLA